VTVLYKYAPSVAWKIDCLIFIHRRFMAIKLTNCNNQKMPQHNYISIMQYKATFCNLRRPSLGWAWRIYVSQKIKCETICIIWDCLYIFILFLLKCTIYIRSLIMYMWFYIFFSFLSKFFICNTHTHTHTHLLMKFLVLINGYRISWPIRRTMIFLLEILEKNNNECILILVIY
jgi:hypothetical protein